jgi:hypothetical protein
MIQDESANHVSRLGEGIVQVECVVNCHQLCLSVSNIRVLKWYYQASTATTFDGRCPALEIGRLHRLDVSDTFVEQKLRQRYRVTRSECTTTGGERGLVVSEEHLAKRG